MFVTAVRSCCNSASHLNMQFSSASAYFTLLGSKYSTWHSDLKPLGGEGYLYEMGPHITDSYLLLPTKLTTEQI